MANEGTIRTHPTIRQAMTIEDVADYVGLSKASIAHYHKQGAAGLPEPKAVLAGRPIWELRKIERWKDERRPRGRPTNDDTGGQTIHDMIPDLEDWWAKIQKGIYQLRLHNELHDELIPRILERSNIGPPTAAQVLHQQFLSHQLMAVRRLADASSHWDPKHSLHRLLGRLANHSKLVTRAWFVEQATSGTDDAFEVNEANRSFDQLADQAKPDQLSKRLVHVDLERLENTSEAVLAYVDEQLAHESARPNSPPPTVKQFKDAQRLLDDLFRKYSLIITGVGEADIVPLMLDWKEPFRAPLWERNDDPQF